ncbi:hypothetical protein ACFLSP_01745 [Bacteroidota bacterium]
MKSLKQTQSGTFLEKTPGKRLIPILSILLLLIPLMAEGQKKEVDAIYLSSGEVFRGTIKDHFNPELIQLETLCANMRLFPVSEVSRIEKEEIDLFAFSREASISTRGYFNRTDLGALIGSGNDNNAIFSLQMVNGYKFGKRYYPGIGVGLEFYEQAVVPVFADFTYLLGTHRVNPFIRGSLGYSIPLEDPEDQWGSTTNNNGGFLYSAGLGTSIRTGSSSALVLSLVYRFQSLKSVYTEEWSNEVLNIEKQFNRIALRIGFIFD